MTLAAELRAKVEAAKLRPRGLPLQLFDEVKAEMEAEADDAKRTYRYVKPSTEQIRRQVLELFRQEGIGVRRVGQDEFELNW